MQGASKTCCARNVGHGGSFLRALLLISAAVFCCLPAGAFAQQASDFPSKNIELVVPFAAGGTADIIARMAAQGVAEAWGKPVIIQNKAGATGAIAAEYVARAPADGHTLLLATGSTHTVNPAYRTDLSFDPIASFSPIARVVVVPNVLVVNPRKVPVNNVRELIEFLKQHPGQLNFGSSGTGGASHFAGELFALMTQTKMTHIPYRGTAPAVADLIAGNVHILIDNMSSVWPQVQQGTLRALGVASLSRSPVAPDLPTVAETVPGFEAVSWNGILGPAKIPDPIVRKLADAFIASMSAPDTKRKIEGLGAMVLPLSRDEFAKFISEDLNRWKTVARDAKLTAQHEK